MKRLFALFVLALCLTAPVDAAPASPDSPASRSAREQSLAQARHLMEAKNYAGAAALYEQLLTRYPDNAPLYLEAFQAYKAAGLTEKALALVESAKLRFKSALMAARSPGVTPRFVTHGKLSAGALFDSNANQGPSSNTMDLGDWKDVTVDNVKERSTFGAYFGAELDGGYRLEEAGNWWIVGDASFNWRGNANNDLGKMDSREWQQGRLAMGARYLSGNDMVDLRLKGMVFDYEFSNNVTAIGPGLRYIHAFTPWFHSITTAGLERRAYNRVSDRNGQYYSAGQYGRFFFGEAGHQFLIGASYLGASTDEKRYDHDGWQALARFDFKLPRGFTVSPYVSFGQDHYDGPATALETRDRRDDRWILGTDVSYAINKDWSLEFGYQYKKADSTSKLYEYDQHVARLGVTWGF